MTLTEDVRPSLLQEALNHIGTDFPTILAGIRRGRYQYEAVPVDNPPAVQPDREYLAHMDEDMLKSCAVRVLYSEKKIAVEIFHALTDGYGGLIFVRALVREYLFLRYGIAIVEKSMECLEKAGARAEEVRDDFLTYAGTATASVNHRKVYCLPKCSGNEEQKNCVTTGIYEVKEIMEAVLRACFHCFGERIFFQRLSGLGCRGRFELNGKAISGNEGNTLFANSILT